MAERYRFTFSPCAQDENRYKVTIKGEEKDLTNLMKEIGNICGRSFVPAAKEFNWGFYIYRVDPKTKERINKILADFEKN